MESSIEEKIINGERVFTIREVAKLIRRSYRRTWELIAIEGKIKAVKVGRVYLVPESSLKDFLRRSKV
ncbi:MAG: excisionase [Aquifex sp.]|nr:MAG: excisionase [Aquifex sp.]